MRRIQRISEGRTDVTAWRVSGTLSTRFNYERKKETKNMSNVQYEVEGSQFNINRTYPGRWTITFNNPPINMFLPETIIELGAVMTELEADPSVKVVVF